MCSIECEQLLIPNLKHKDALFLLIQFVIGFLILNFIFTV